MGAGSLDDVATDYYFREDRQALARESCDGIGRGDSVLYLSVHDLLDSLRRVQDHPVPPTHPDLENLTILSSPYPELSRRIGRELQADARKGVASWAADLVQPLVSAHKVEDKCGSGRDEEHQRREGCGAPEG